MHGDIGLQPPTGCTPDRIATSAASAPDTGRVGPMAGDDNAELGGMKCIGIALIIFGILGLENIPLGLPALVAGSMVACCASDLPSMKKQLGCAKCCSIIGIVLAVIIAVIYAIVGGVVTSAAYRGCEQVQSGIACRRQLTEQEPSSLDFFGSSLPPEMVSMTRAASPFVPSWLLHTKRLSPLFRLEKGVPTPLPLPGGKLDEVAPHADRRLTEIQPLPPPLPPPSPPPPSPPPPSPPPPPPAIPPLMTCISTISLAAICWNLPQMQATCEGFDMPLNGTLVG